MTTASPDGPLHSRPGTWIAFAASLALHGAVPALAFLCGGSAGSPDAKALTVELVTLDSAAEIAASPAERTAPPASAALRSDIGDDERVQRVAPGIATVDAAPAGRVPDPRVLESSSVGFETPPADDRAAGTPTAARETKPDRTLLAKSVPKGDRDRDRASRGHGRDRSPAKPPLPGETEGSAEGASDPRTSSLGSPGSGTGRLPPAWREALVSLLQEQIERCYAAPAETSRRVILPVIDIRLRPDGSLSSQPRIARSGGGSVDLAIAQAALRAVQRCAPYRIPARFAPYHGDWKEIRAEFEFSAS